MIRLVGGIQPPDAPSGVAKQQDFILIEVQLPGGTMLVGSDDACTIDRSGRGWCNAADRWGVFTARGPHEHGCSIITGVGEASDTAQFERESRRIVEATELAGAQQRAKSGKVARRELGWVFHGLGHSDNPRGLTGSA